jgi:hypothetical protein
LAIIWLLPCRLAAAREARGTPPGCKKARVGRLQQDARRSKRSGCALGRRDDDDDDALMVVTSFLFNKVVYKCACVRWCGV